MKVLKLMSKQVNGHNTINHLVVTKHLIGYTGTSLTEFWEFKVLKHGNVGSFL